MNMKRLLTLVAFFATLQASAQQVNPVPDYVFANRMSAGRNTVTDTAAYLSIGPRYGATRGMMPPMVVDTASFSANKRNGLLIFSVQKNKFLYWDSVRVQWSDMAGSSGSYIRGSGTASYLPKFSDSVTLGNSIIYESSDKIGIRRTSPLATLHVADSTSGGVNTALIVENSSKFAASAQGTQLGFITYNNAGSTLSGAIRAQITNAANGATILRFLGYDGTNLLERMTITSSGFVGVNQTVPEGNFNAVGGSSRNAQIIIGYSNTSENYIDANLTIFRNGSFAETMRLTSSRELLIRTQTDNGDYVLQVSGNIYNTGTAVLAATSGIVGIGTTSPTALASTSGILHLNGLASNSEIHLTNTSTGTTATDGGLLLQFGTRTLLYNLENSSLEFGTNNAERGRINAGGEWIIDASGTDAGDYKLQVVGNLYNTGTAVLSATSGSVGIGTSSPAHKLDVSGLIRSNGGTVFVQNSGTESLGFRFDALTIGYDTTAKVGWITAGGASQRTNLVLQANGGASGGSVGIGTETVNASAKLEVSSAASGFLPPRMTTTQRDAISSPAAGLIIYNTTTSKLQVYTTTWTDLH